MATLQEQLATTQRESASTVTALQEQVVIAQRAVDAKAVELAITVAKLSADVQLAQVAEERAAMAATKQHDAEVNALRMAHAQVRIAFVHSTC